MNVKNSKQERNITKKFNNLLREARLNARLNKKYALYYCLQCPFSQIDINNQIKI